MDESVGRIRVPIKYQLPTKYKFQDMSKHTI